MKQIKPGYWTGRLASQVYTRLESHRPAYPIRKSSVGRLARAVAFECSKEPVLLSGRNPNVRH